ncbi:hypothetical protein P4H32_32395, partial [Bacillus cereus]|nr:hypothetical protein [Bacillus cereus]
FSVDKYTKCREKLRPGEQDDPHDHGGWVPALYIGFNEEGRNNLLQLIKLWNEENQETYNLEHQIDVSK